MMSFVPKIRHHVAPDGHAPNVDDARFDDMAKALGSLTTRRLTLGALLGGALGLLGGADAEATKDKKKQWCHCPDGNPANCATLKLKKKARKKHRQKHPFDSPGPCEPFTCPAGQTNCDGVCKDLETDAANCGTCGNACGLGRTCCSGRCRNLLTDDRDCGTCGNACPFFGTCCSGRCKNTFDDPTNCGRCGITCPGGEICAVGDCCRPAGASCSSNGECCSSTCVSLFGGGICA